MGPTASSRHARDRRPTDLSVRPSSRARYGAGHEWCLISLLRKTARSSKNNPHVALVKRGVREVWWSAICHAGSHGKAGPPCDGPGGRRAVREGLVTSPDEKYSPPLVPSQWPGRTRVAISEMQS